MADIDNMRGDTLRVVEENTLDNMRGVTQRVIQENTIDNTRGVTYRVYNVNGGSAPVIDELNVTPSTSAQVITAPEGTDGYSPVNVSAVTSAIDANIVAGNIKKDVSILGVTGSYEGQTPTGTMYIISNGTYNVADKAIANVQVPTAAPTYYIEKTVDANGILQNTTNLINLNGVTSVNRGVLAHQFQGVSFPANTALDLSGITSIGDSACQYAFAQSYNITSVDLSGLTTISIGGACNYMFFSCSSITSVNLSNLTTVSGVNGCSNMFQGCTGLTTLDLSKLTTVSGSQACSSMIQGCNALTSANLSSLTTVSGSSGCFGMVQTCGNLTTANLSSLTTISGSQGCGSMFSSCSKLTSVDLSSLSIISASTACSSMFASCSILPSISFPALKEISPANTQNQFNNIFQNCTALTEIHFPSNMQTRVSQLAGYSTHFGATNATIYFDLPATVTLTDANSIEYSRNPKYDTATALGWKVGAYGTTNFTPYYTSGTTDPAVGDTIYSDAACTTAVTTISSIA